MFVDVEFHYMHVCSTTTSVPNSWDSSDSREQHLMRAQEDVNADRQQMRDQQEGRQKLNYKRVDSHVSNLQLDWIPDCMQASADGHQSASRYALTPNFLRYLRPLGSARYVTQDQMIGRQYCLCRLLIEDTVLVHAAFSTFP